MVATFEKNLIVEYIQKYGNPTAAAKALKIDQSTISRKICRYGLNKK